MKSADPHMNISGEVVLFVRFGQDGKVRTAKATGGNPLAIATLLDVVPQWEFKAVNVGKKHYGGCGRLTIMYDFGGPMPRTAVQ
jgi:hypothetical protein